MKLKDFLYKSYGHCSWEIWADGLLDRESKCAILDLDGVTGIEDINGKNWFIVHVDPRYSNRWVLRKIRDMSDSYLKTIKKTPDKTSVLSSLAGRLRNLWGKEGGNGFAK